MRLCLKEKEKRLYLTHQQTNERESRGLPQPLEEAQQDLPAGLPTLHLLMDIPQPSLFPSFPALFSFLTHSLTKNTSFGRRHSTEVAFALLTRLL